MSVSVFRIVPKERDRRGYELVGVFPDSEKAHKFIDQHKNDRHAYEIGVPRKENWWKKLSRWIRIFFRTQPNK